MMADICQVSVYKIDMKAQLFPVVKFLTTKVAAVKKIFPIYQVSRSLIILVIYSMSDKRGYILYCDLHFHDVLMFPFLMVSQVLSVIERGATIFTDKSAKIQM